ncbi:mRNA-decapping enzyme-like protein [Cynara cardunculus var. scolymus]|uniref:mRNA-decapping enzyme-like protein n=1 Tax=Cynara cardunculus var. scolymus TaxID=59895 RepID=UPI000D629C68|nr:mRNA-decapping enzyme-like protein [Cynara cardunculus var. scolymus]
MSQSGKLMPNLDQNSTKVLNLTVLQRMDPYIEEILITAAHVTFYEFNVELNQWSRKDVEGSLFVVKRNTQPRFQFIVMNRRNTENLVENLLGDFEFELQVPYLLYRNASQEVNGIWFYNSRESEDVANLFTRILGAYSKVPPNSKVNKSEFEELEAVPTSAVTEPPFTTPSSIDVPDDSSFVNFFSSAINLGHTSSIPFSSVKPYHNSTMASPATPSPLLNGPTMQIPSLAPSTPAMPLRVDPESVNSSNLVTNLFKPLSFFTPSSSLSPTMPQPISSIPVTALQPPLNIQRSHGVPLLQPFPPPTPPLSLTPNSTSPPNYGPLGREKVRDALMLLAQDNQFIDMLYQALLKANQKS